MAKRVMDVAGITKFLKNCKSFDQVLNKVKIITLEQGRCTAEMKVEEEHTNPMGGLHGGLSATLVDCLSTYALMTKVPEPNVSVDIHMTYAKGAVVGDDILIDASIIRSGKKLAFLEVFIKNKANGDVLVKGSHTKYIFQ